MKKTKINSLDIIIENLAENFSKIEDFDKFQESEEGKELFDFVIKSTSEMENFQSLFLDYYIPAANKSIADSWKLISTSKYRQLINTTKEELKDNLYETIRLGYVGLFHKYESYLKSLVNATNYLMKDINQENKLLSIEKYCKKEFGVDIFRSHHKFSTVSKINYICNCIKHYDGYPIKEPKHSYFKYSNPDKKICLNKDDFKHDIEMLKLHCESLLSQLMMMGFKQYFELDYNTIKESLKPELRDKTDTEEKLNKLKENFKIVLSDFYKT
jgi:hypothetical protein